MKNFSDIAENLFKAGNEQELRTFLTKLFYFLRRKQNEDHFGFFFEPWLTKKSEIEYEFYEKLCNWNFYFDEIEPFYFDIVKKNLNLYLKQGSSSTKLISSLTAGMSLLSFMRLYQVFDEYDNSDFFKILSLWKEGNVPINILQSLIAAAFPETTILKMLNLNNEKMVPHKDFIEIIKRKTKITSFDNEIWKKFIDLEFLSCDHEQNPLKSDLSLISENINSDSSVNIAYGLYTLRKTLESSDSPKFTLNHDLMESIVNLVFHDDRYSFWIHLL